MPTQPAIKALLQRALCAIVLCLCCVLCAPPAPAHADASRKAVLYLNSYHNGYSWSDDILAGIRKVLEASGRALVFQVEYMDSKKFLYKETEQTLYRLYRDKFRDTRFDLIIASDNAAMDFLTRFRDELFPGVPVVFCGLNDVKPESLRGRNMTGDHLPLMILDHQAFDDVNCWLFGPYSVDGWGSHGREYYSECFYYAFQNGS